jgi:hypothetical protein
MKKCFYRKSLSFAIPALVLMLCITGAYGKKQELGSQWTDREIVVDGQDSEWKAPSITRDKITLRAYNDDRNMVICVTTKDRAVKARIAGMGMTVWLNRDGGEEKNLGVRFPLGMKDRKKGPPPQDDRSRGNGSGDSSGRGPGPRDDSSNGKSSGSDESMGMRPGPGDDMEEREQFEEKMLSEQDKLELVIPGRKEAAKLSLGDAAASGISAKLLCSKGKLVYELKIPLDGAKAFPVGISSSEPGSGKIIAVGIDIPGLSFPKRSTQSQKSGASFEVGAGGPGGGMGGPGGGMGGPGGGMGGPGGGMGGPGGGVGGPGGGMGGPGGGMGGPGGGDFEQDMAAMKKSVNLWITVKLACPPSAESVKSLR